MNNPLQKQVGGRHYKDFTIQPVELFAATRWDYFQSSIARYILRYKNKNGIEDIEKAIHIAHLASDLSVEEKGRWRIFAILRCSRKRTTSLEDSKSFSKTLKAESGVMCAIA